MTQLSVPVGPRIARSGIETRRGIAGLGNHPSAIVREVLSPESRFIGYILVVSAVPCVVVRLIQLAGHLIF